MVANRQYAVVAPRRDCVRMVRIDRSGPYSPGAKPSPAARAARAMGACCPDPQAPVPPVLYVAAARLCREEKRGPSGATYRARKPEQLDLNEDSEH